MTDNITLPRADAEQIRAALVSGEKLYAAIEALDAALAEPEPATEKDVDIEFCRITLNSCPIDSRGDFRTGFRAAERFHGIGGSET
jgi:hypothetical protein